MFCHNFPEVQKFIQVLTYETDEASFLNHGTY